ncbi:MAG TPA: helix-turn-helix domain-containing protein [Acidimicrobiia bacterium]|nr:helix-turn-helix domain-containing protein [Acidimicrobiia bacterium]
MAQATTFEIEDVRVLEALNNPTRLRILYQLMEASTAGELARRLDVPVTRLYYHLNLLQDLGVVEVVETRKRGAMLERVYRAVATNFVPARDLIEKATDKDRVISAGVGVVLDGARLDAMAGLLGHLQSPGTDPTGTLGRCVIPMSEVNASKFTERIGEIVEEMKLLEDKDGEEYAFSFVFFPMVGPVKGEKL